MRRPLCVFCIGMLGLESVRAFMPQTERFVPFAAFFVALCFALCCFDRTRKPALCLLLGAAAGLTSVYTTNARLERLRASYAGRTVQLTAEVERAETLSYTHAVEATLRVENVNGKAADFRVVCAEMPTCAAGERIQGYFILSAPEEADRLDIYADGIALRAEVDAAKPEPTVLGQSQSFRARTHRLQQLLSIRLRARMNTAAGGVLAAMTVGDRGHLSSKLRSAYRGAGLSHVLVVSGLHVSILCGEIFGGVPSRREYSYRRRRGRALRRALLALLLVGVTGFTPSVCRAAVAVWVSALGVWLYGPPDALTSLAAAGILMTAGNSYAVCDIGFELSFAAVVGTVAGGACLRRVQDERVRKARQAAEKRRKRSLLSKLWPLAESACIAVCASAATFPVLVLRGLSVSLWAVVSSVAVLWMVQPLLLLGLATAFTGLLPVLEPVYALLSRAAELLAGLLNAWAVWLSTKPGAGLYFDTAYAALVCLLLCGLCWLAFHGRVRLWAAVPGILFTAAVAVGLGNALSRDVVHIDLVGSTQAPAVVISQQGSAVVLFRGWNANRNAVETQLARRGVTKVELLADLRIDPKTTVTMNAEKTLRVTKLPANTGRKFQCTPATVEFLRTRKGCLARVTIGNRQFLVLSGEVRLAKPLRAGWLLAGMADPDNASVQWENVLALRRYNWMKPDVELAASLSLRRTGGLKVE